MNGREYLIEKIAETSRHLNRQIGRYSYEAARDKPSRVILAQLGRSEQRLAKRIERMQKQVRAMTRGSWCGRTPRVQNERTAAILERMPKWATAGLI